MDDPAGPPDAEVQRFERLLGRLRSAPQVPALPDMVRDTVRLTAGPTYSIRFLVPALAAAAAIVMMADRTAVVDALAALVPMPASVTRDAVMRLDQEALDQWWDALGLRDTGWWRKWKTTVP